MINPDYLDIDELKIETQIRNINGPILKQLDSLKAYLTDEYAGEKDAPIVVHSEAQKNPIEEVIVCIDKLKDLQSKFREHLSRENDEVEDLLDIITTRLIHIQGRVKRISNNEEVQAVGSVEKLIQSCGSMLVVMEKIRQRELNNEASIIAINELPLDFELSDSAVRSDSQVNLNPSGMNTNIDFGNFSHVPTNLPIGLNNSNPSDLNLRYQNSIPRYNSNAVQSSGLPENFSRQPRIEPNPSSRSHIAISERNSSNFIHPNNYFHLNSNVETTTTNARTVYSTPKPASYPINPNPTISHNLSSTQILTEPSSNGAFEKITEISALMDEFLAQVRNMTISGHVPRNIPIPSNPLNLNPSSVPIAGTSNERPQVETNRTSAHVNFPPVNVTQSSISHQNTQISQIISKWNISYDGSAKDVAVERFLFRVEYLASVFGISDSQLVKNFGFLVRGVAKEFYWMVIEKTANLDLSWKQLRCAFINQYQIRRSDSDIKRILDARKQRNRESFQDFYNDLLCLSLPLREPLFDQDLIELMQRNMRYGLQVECAGKGFRSVPEFIHFCICLEDAWNRIGYVPEFVMFPKSHNVQRVSAFDSYVPPQATDSSNIPGVTQLSHHAIAEFTQSSNHHQESSVQPSSQKSCQLLLESELQQPSYNTADTFVNSSIDHSVEALLHPRPNSNSGTVQPHQYVIPSCCFNCEQIGHNWVDCTIPHRRLFCYTCGWPNTVKPKCPYCQFIRSQGNQNAGIVNRGSAQFPNPKPNPSTPSPQLPLQQRPF